MIVFKLPEMLQPLDYKKIERQKAEHLRRLGELTKHGLAKGEGSGMESQFWIGYVARSLTKGNS